MALSISIAVLLITSGIAADNLIMSKMNMNNITLIKSGKAIWVQIVLFTIQLQVLKYGYWFASFQLMNLKNHSKWIALFMLFSIVLKMIQEFKLKPIHNKTYPNLDDFLNIAFATSLYVFVLGFALRFLEIDQPAIYKTVIPCLLFFLLIGSLFKNFNSGKAIQLTQIIAIAMIFTGVLIFLINI
ncbi:manganese efflux pump [Flavobacterium chilense]|uniref:Putative manganese efflux pump n=1 Tax=Flavobacterium chilense TaxID=946677 RepID=A0A1M6ZTT9_9FLAO|nr:manganese efflux pump [Flavobacterium chilense]SHL33901.1 Putative manganese efflux pump [Flavobacterium chilense]